MKADRIWAAARVSTSGASGREEVARVTQEAQDMSGHTPWREIRHKSGTPTEARKRELAAAFDREVASYWSWQGLPRRLRDRWHDRRARSGPAR
jgi:hypothetical protein